MSIDATGRSTPLTPPTTPKVTLPLPAAESKPEPTPTAAIAPQEQLQLEVLPGSKTAPTVSLVDSTPANREEVFTNTFGKSATNSLKPNDPRLLKTLAGYHKKLVQNPDMQAKIGANPRGLDFMYALEKAATGKALTKDDIGSIQLFLTKDTRYGSELAYPGNATGHDRKYGFRTHAALDRFLNNFQASDMIPDPYYQRLDREGVAYAKFKP